MRSVRRGDMRQYRVHPYRKAAIVDGHLHWVICCMGDDLLEVGDYEEAIALACKLASSDASSTGEDVEVLIESIPPLAARRLFFPGDGLRSASGDPLSGASAA